MRKLKRMLCFGILCTRTPRGRHHSNLTHKQGGRGGGEREREREINVLFNDALNTFYLRLYGVSHMVKDHSDSEKGEKERNVLFNDALNTFYLRLYGVRHMVKDHTDSERGNPLPPHRLLLSNKGSIMFSLLL